MAKLLKSSILWTKKCTSETANHCVSFQSTDFNKMHNGLFSPNFFFEYFRLQTSAKIIHGLVERCIQLFVLTAHFRFQDYEYISFQPLALLPHWHYPHVTTLCIVTHFGSFLQPFSLHVILCEKNIEIWIKLFSPWIILFSPYSWHFSMFYVCFVHKYFT